MTVDKSVDDKPLFYSCKQQLAVGVTVVVVLLLVATAVVAVACCCCCCCCFADANFASVAHCTNSIDFIVSCLFVVTISLRGL